MVRKSGDDSLYIVLLSIHGLIRSHDLELGRDADTGGQTKYVVELANALAVRPEIGRVDLVTRLINDHTVDSSYAQDIESLSPKAQIVRIAAGPEGYIRKETLWDYLDNFADNLLGWLHQQTRLPDFLHSHYADAGYVGVRLAHWLGLPLIHTGHSLGRDKRRRLLALGLSMEDIENTYKMSCRIGAEEETLINVDLVVTSTSNEIEEQYGLYDCYSPEKMAIIPPGIDLAQFHPPTASGMPQPITQNLAKFLKEPNKPIILALSRPDYRKNIVTLLEAFGESPAIQTKANLVIIAGNRDDIRELHEGAQSVLTELLVVIDRYDLYGKVAMPKHHNPEDVADIYRTVTESHGVFVNAALTEPFGLTLLEAAASGLPVVATENGGPVDIIGNCRNGILVDPLNKVAINQAILSILENPRLWQQFSANGLKKVRKFYSWDAHASAYLEKIKPLYQGQKIVTKHAPVIRSGQYRNKAIFTAIDNTLLGDDQGLRQFVKVIRDYRKKFLFGIATGRRLDSVLSILKNHQIPMPEILITSLGTEIFFGPQLIADVAWADHIDHLWTPNVIRRIMARVNGITLQAKTEQSHFKISYYYDKNMAPPMDDILSLLRQQELSVTATLSFGQYLDITPARASKGHAVRYVAGQWKIPLEHVLVTGGSGGDEDMLRGNTLGVVVANRHQEELSVLSNTAQVYFAERSHAWGIMEALEHYRFFEII